MQLYRAQQLWVSCDINEKLLLVILKGEELLNMSCPVFLFQWKLHQHLNNADCCKALQWAFKANFTASFFYVLKTHRQGHNQGFLNKLVP